MSRLKEKKSPINQDNTNWFEMGDRFYLNQSCLGHIYDREREREREKKSHYILNYKSRKFNFLLLS